jgi:hypothetical protein
MERGLTPDEQVKQQQKREAMKRQVVDPEGEENPYYSDEELTRPWKYQDEDPHAGMGAILWGIVSVLIIMAYLVYHLLVP